MSFLIFVYRHQDIIRRKSELNMKLSDLRRKLMDLQSYSASIADGKITMSDMMQVPSSQFGRMTAFMTFSDQAARAGANQNFSIMQMSGQLQPPQGQAQRPQEQQEFYNQMVYKSLYEQERQRFSKKEEKLLNKQDMEIQQQTAKYEDQLKMLNAEEESVTKAEDEGAKKSAPQYVA